MGDDFFIVQEGSVAIQKQEKLLRRINEESYFGERALLLNEARSATVVAEGDVRVLRLSREDFMSFMDDNVFALLMERMRLQDDTVLLEDLDYCDCLGQGAYGSVYLTKSKKTGVLYAIKTIPRVKIEYSKIYNYVLREKSILIQLDHPFIVKLVKTFKDEQRLYYLMQFVNGEDFLRIQQRLGKMDQVQARFYIQCFVLMLEHLHERKIAHRDLKPENIMIGEDGYPLLIDFGTAKVITGRTYTSLGTPHYMAPEVIMGKGYTTNADFWSIGIIMYEMLFRKFPFGQKYNDVMDIYQSVLRDPLETPDSSKIPGECENILHLLLEKNSARRKGGML